MEAKLDPLEPGDPRRISSFTLEGVLGHGGMGRVYLGRTPDQRLVALKVVHEHLARDQQFVLRFRREIEAARSIPELYTAGFVDADSDARRPWLATTFIDGQTLQQQVERSGPLRRDQILRLVRSLANALDAIHGRWVHRDLKPSNVVIDAFGTPHIIDFGIIAHAVAASGLAQTGPGITVTGQVFGTYGYMSPEQRRGDRTGPATDIYALGMTALFAATARRPVDGVPDPDLSAVTDPDVAELVRACTASEAAGRPDARSLAARADALLGGGGTLPPTTVPPTPTPMPTPPPVATPAVPPPSVPTVLPPSAQPSSVPPSSAQPSSVRPAAVTAPPSVGPPPSDGSRPRRRRMVLLAVGAAVVLVAALGVLVPRWWGGGEAAALSGCGALPRGGDRTFVAEAPDGQCYGVTDVARDGDSAESGFGRDPAARRLQARLFGTNRLNLPVTASDLTVILFASLTCPSYGPDGVTCADGRQYDAERQELQALQLAQGRTDLPGDVHVVVANAGADMKYSREVVRLVLAHRAAFGRVVAVGGGDSRAVTKEAIRDLVAAGIPFIAPNLSSDDDGPGMPFIDTPGFLQMQRPNQTYARALVSFVATYSGKAGRPVLVYRADDPTDLYTASLARDVQFEARANPATDGWPARIISTPAAVPASVCRRTTPAPEGSDPPAALVFADRWNTFGALAARLTALCGAAGPALLVGDDSVNRVMTNDAARASLTAPWPLAYFTKGVQCAEVDAAARRAPSGEAAALLGAVRGTLRLCDAATGSQQMGDSISLFWDAITLGRRALPAGGQRLVDTTFVGATGPITVKDARVVWGQTGLPRPLCVLTVDRSGGADRSIANCETAFGKR